LFLWTLAVIARSIASPCFIGTIATSPEHAAMPATTTRHPKRRPRFDPSDDRGLCRTLSSCIRPFLCPDRISEASRGGLHLEGQPRPAEDD
jgi:hypothetical protein